LVTVNRFYLIIITITLLTSMCGKEIIKEEQILEKSEREKVYSLLKRLKEINEHSPNSFKAHFIIEGILNNKKRFKSIGNAVYNKTPTKMKITFIDFVFKSPITIIVQDGPTLKFYFPTEKKLLIDNINTINLKNYLDLDLEFTLLYRFITGAIPVIENYQIREGLIAKAKEKKDDEVYIILENDRYFETISFKKDLPNKILLKTSKEKAEFYLEKPCCKDNRLSYKSIKFVSTTSGHRIIIRMNSWKDNVKVSPRSISQLRLPRGTKVIRVH
jgi:hypothetical protein